MKNELKFDPVCLIYPGTFTPMVKEEDVQSAVKYHMGDTVQPPVNVTELAREYKVEVAIPGIKREDFLVHSDGNVLSVCVLQEEALENEGEVFTMHEFNYACFDRHINLPGNADFELASAEYKDGLLRLRIPKATASSKSFHTNIPVY